MSGPLADDPLGTNFTVVADPALTFNNLASDTITRGGVGSFAADGFMPGHTLFGVPITNVAPNTLTFGGDLPAALLGTTTNGNVPLVAGISYPANITPQVNLGTQGEKNSALVAVSSGLLQSMNKEEVEAVLGHEVAHVANGDMVTLTLIQGVVNTFVIFLSRIIGMIVDKAIFRTERGVGPGFFIASLVAQVVLGILASMIVAWFSRQREFRADRGSAQLMGTPRPMINALARLGGVPAGEMPQAFEAHGINQSRSRFLGLLASHPPIEQRIAALQARG